MNIQNALWAVIAFLAVAAFVFGFGGFVHETTLLAQSAGLTYLLIITLNWRARSSHVDR